MLCISMMRNYSVIYDIFLLRMKVAIWFHFLSCENRYWPIPDNNDDYHFKITRWSSLLEITVMSLWYHWWCYQKYKVQNHILSSKWAQGQLIDDLHQWPPYEVRVMLTQLSDKILMPTHQYFQNLLFSNSAIVNFWRR